MKFCLAALPGWGNEPVRIVVKAEDANSAMKRAGDMFFAAFSYVRPDPTFVGGVKLQVLTIEEE